MSTTQPLAVMVMLVPLVISAQVVFASLVLLLLTAMTTSHAQMILAILPQDVFMSTTITTLAAITQSVPRVIIVSVAIAWEPPLHALMTTTTAPLHRVIL